MPQPGDGMLSPGKWVCLPALQLTETSPIPNAMRNVGDSKASVRHILRLSCRFSFQKG